MKNHPVFDKFIWKEPVFNDIVNINSIGVIQRKCYDFGMYQNQPLSTIYQALKKQHLELPRIANLPSTSSKVGPEFSPPLDEEYFEWIDLLESVIDYAAVQPHRPYTFMELGAGFGRWLVNAVVALRQIGEYPFMAVAVEADMQHVAWLTQHALDNSIPKDRLSVHQAPITGDGREVYFLTGNHGAWYGQAIIDDAYAEHILQSLRFQIKEKIATEKNRLINRFVNPSAQKYLSRVKSITLQQILSRTVNPVDLLDMDVQGVEAEVVESSIGSLTKKVLRLHLGTHSEAVEKRLRECLRNAGWTCVSDYPCLSTIQTNFGVVKFGDGVQSWINPSLHPGRACLS
jgi:FkbM family methyltransferase